MTAAVLLIIFYFTAIAFVATGWVMNLVAFLEATEWAPVVVARVVGLVVVPLGALLGWVA